MENNFFKNILESISKENLSKLDGWRGFLAFLVMVAHCNQILVAPIIGSDNYVSWGFGAIAHFSVLGFFAISGIAIGMSINLNIHRNEGNVDWKEYIIARISRIYPPLIFSVILCYVYKIIIFKFNLLGFQNSYKLESDLYAARDFYNFTFNDVINTILFKAPDLINVNGALWSLIIEWWLYFLAFFLVAVFFTKNKFFKILAILLFFIAFNKIKHLNSFVYALIWIIGFLFYVVGSKRHKILNYLTILSLLSLVIYSYEVNFIKDRLDISNLPIVQILLSTLFLGIIFKFPTKSVFNRMSNYSYTLYIIHFPTLLFILSLFHKITSGSLLYTIVLSFCSIILILIASYQAHRFFENKKYFSKILNNSYDYLSIKFKK